ncbi:MAG: UDP-N-acetylglucosamine--N-acetylmuramyl-(pentapeptide) pyrophosphoryl-undecaprenol N-acetylglucosamine transferase [Proteobacteria bacterium]|nr:UDP-N-acetylglucosamine--N-acetylmuramyl-(pentapeptide) pyrophosphoryl-undecaprenol N-acetylglucosamine transferase [Pseudomonadota bacterium]
MAVIALAGGGTGGHVYPAIAIGDELRSRGHTVLYYGDPERLEARVAPQRGYEFRPVVAPQYPRSGLVGKIRFALGLLKATLATRSALKRDKVDAVLGVGGYISAPAVLASWTLGRGRAIHEANVVPGMANKLCARVAQQILLTYEKTATRLPGAAPRNVVGVPVNPAVLEGDRSVARSRYGLDPAVPTVLFVGGSLGAARLNELAIAIAKSTPGYQVLHLTGKRYHAEVRGAFADEVPGHVALVDYEDRMGDAYACADLVVCRAGSSTLAELTAVGKASLLIPSPNVTENHQEENARGLEEVGAAEVLIEAGWDIHSAAAKVHELMAGTDALKDMAAKAKAQARMDAAERGADVVEKLLSR